jgi:23S rRNA (adenine2030-N6)-methyltransferase
MFSYRHAFHAGNHADVLKHLTLIATLHHLTQKDTALTVIDTHAGAGLYRLDSEFAETSGEAAEGIAQLSASPDLAPALQDYLDLVASFNAGERRKVYPGSPFIIHRLLREDDRLKLYELHPTDAKTLDANVAQLNAGRQVTVLREDGFGCVPKFLPPPSRRALLLCDPSYEIKSDYTRVGTLVADALKRFATGCYVVWYPIIPRPEAHALPRRLKTLATQASKPWLHATLTVKSSKMSSDPEAKRPGLPASGMFIINPPHTLKPVLAAALPQLVKQLGQDRNAGYTLDSAGV